MTTGLIFMASQLVLVGHASIYNEVGLLDGIGCDFNGFTNQLSGSMELYILAALAIERYFAIVKGKPLSKHQILYMIAFGWIESLLVSM